MPDIERLEFIETTAFKERKQTIDKVNEIIDYINTELDYLKNPTKKIPLELTKTLAENDEYYYKYSNEIKDGDTIVICGRDKRDNYNTVNFSTTITFKKDFIRSRGIGINSIAYLNCDTTNGLYINIIRVDIDDTDSGYFKRGIVLYRDTVSFESISVNSKQTVNISDNYDIYGYIIRGLE